MSYLDYIYFIMESGNFAYNIFINIQKKNYGKNLKLSKKYNITIYHI